MEQGTSKPPPEINEKTLETSSAGEELFALRFTLRAKAFFSVLLWEYVMSRECIQNTIVGLLLWTLFIVNIINGSIRMFDVTMVLAFVFVLLPSFYLLLINPIRIFRATMAIFGKKYMNKNETTYHIYKDSYLMETAPEKTSMWVSWKDLVKIKVLPNAYLLYYTKVAVHVIPKKVFAGEKDKKEMMRSLIKDARSQMKKNKQLNK